MRHALQTHLLLALLLLYPTDQCTRQAELFTKADTIIGIDLGTTYSCVGVYQHGRAEIIANDQGNRITPSYVAFTSDGERLIGEGAVNQLTTNPENTIFDVKRLIGRRWNEPYLENDVKKFPFRVVKKDNKPNIQVKVGSEDKMFTPEELSAMVLTKMKATAEAFLGRVVNKAVVTVPAYFNDAQRQATKDAGSIAGFETVKIINEPTAAAFAYGLEHGDEKKKTILVFDLGGGTFDVTLLTTANNVFNVLATNGDTRLGGEDFDQRVIDYFVELFKRKTGRNIRKSNRAVQKLRREVEKAKRNLSYQYQARLEMDSFYEGLDFSETLTRAKFEELNMDYFRSTLDLLTQVLDDADLQKEDVDDIVLVGGSTRIPKIQELVQQYFNGKEPSKRINPDEAVAQGAALLAGVLANQPEVRDLVLVDVNPLTLGIETVGGVMTGLIPRNTPIPSKKSKVFSTFVDNQSGISVKVYEGERTMTVDNHLLGQFDLTGIPLAPGGVPEIEVTFEIDDNGILKVAAESKESGSRSELVIQSHDNNLSAADIARMIREAEMYSEQDQISKERVEARNQLESYIYSLGSKFGSSTTLTDREKRALEKVFLEEVAWLEDNRAADWDKFQARMMYVKARVKSIVRDEL